MLAAGDAAHRIGPNRGSTTSTTTTNIGLRLIGSYALLLYSFFGSPKPPNASLKGLPKASRRLPKASHSVFTTSLSHISPNLSKNWDLLPKSPKITKIDQKKHEWDLRWSLKKMALTSRKTKVPIEAPIIWGPSKISFVIGCLRLSSKLPQNAVFERNQSRMRSSMDPQKIGAYLEENKSPH